MEKSSVYQDYRDLLARPGVDAVVIATPVFLHPEHFEAAVGARKHIYCEKPAAADVAGVKRLLWAAQTADPRQHAVFGFQNRFSPEYRAAEKIVNEGQLGQILFVESHFIRSGVPLNPVPSRIPAEQHLRRWNVWRRTSGDIIVEQDCHSLDVLNWFVKGHPLRAVGSGGRVKRASGDNLDHLAVVFQVCPSLCKTGWRVNFRLARDPLRTSQKAIPGQRRGRPGGEQTSVCPRITAGSSCLFALPR